MKTKVIENKTIGRNKLSYSAILHCIHLHFWSLHVTERQSEIETICENINTPAGISLLKVNNGNTRSMYEICSKLTMRTSERRHWRRSGVFIGNFEKI